MTAPKARVPTPPEIRLALNGLEDAAEVATGESGSIESLRSSGSIPVSRQERIKLPFSLGDLIAGKYQIVGLLGAGGVGYVVSAMHLELGEMVALKFLREESLAFPEVVARFAREARAAAKIKSEYVARVFDVGSLPNGTPFIVMEYLQGEDLADVIAHRGRPALKLAVEYIIQACEALACAHSVGIVHRDIKPENLFLTRQAEGVEIIKVLDFGISKVALESAKQRGERQFVRTMMPMGTPAYMSPEQIRSAGDVDSRTDVWALGCVLFELLTGKCAFEAPTLMQLGASILEREPRSLEAFLPDVPSGLEAVVLRCLQKNVNDRYQNVGELAAALYPFGPRRARLSVERSNYLVNAADGSSAPLDLGSVAPPALEPGRRPTQRSEITSLEVGAGASHTTPLLQPTLRSKLLLGSVVAGTALVALLATYTLSRPRGAASPRAASATTAPTASAASSQSSPPAEPTPSPMLAPGNGQRAATGSATSAPDASVRAAAEREARIRAAAPRGGARSVFGKARLPGPKGTAQPARGDDGEYDVGY